MGPLTAGIVYDLVKVVKEVGVSSPPTTARDLRLGNRSAILRELLFSGEANRQSLAARTRLSAATVGLVIGDLLDEGLVVEVGTEESTGGRPRTLLRIAAERGVAVGVDVGEAGIRAEAFDLGWRTRGTIVLPLDRGREPATVVRTIERAVRQVVVEAGIDEERLLGVGVGVPGIVERGTDAVVHAVSFGWDDVPLGRMLRERIAAPVLVDNGAKTMGQAEMWFGAGRGVADAVVALLGIGVGAAVFTGGHLYRGAQSSAGEWGHTPVVVGGAACRCGSRGCLEAYIGGAALLDRWAELDPDAAASAAGTDTERLGELLAAAGHDGAARRVAEELAEYLGAGLATLINLFNPQRIVLAGAVGLLLTPSVLEHVRARARAYALRQPYESVEITLGRLGIDAVALGAATLVVDELLAGGFVVAHGPAAATAAAIAPGGAA